METMETVRAAEPTAPTPPAAPPEPSGRPPRRPRNRWMLIPAVLLCLLLTAAGVWAGRESTRRYPLTAAEAQPTGTTTAPSLFDPDYRSLYPDLQVIDDPDLGVIWIRRQTALQENALAAEAFTEKDGVPYYEKDGVRSGLGVDVSEHQGEIDWEKVRASGVEFAMVRVGYRGYGYGALHEDAYFRANIRGAQAAGLRVGAYFFSQAVTPAEAREEADFAANLLHGYTLDLPLAMDWEAITQDSARTDEVEAEALTALCRAFCEQTEKNGYTPMLYMYKTLAYRRLTLGDFPDVPFWIAELQDTPSFFYRFSLWQYSYEGHVDGIDGFVDMNLGFFGADGELIQ